MNIWKEKVLVQKNKKEAYMLMFGFGYAIGFSIGVMFAYIFLR